MAQEMTKKKKLRVEIAKQMLTLSTAGFGLVAALAWNSLIQEVVNTYIKPYLPGAGIISLLIYAIVITVIAVFITVQLTSILEKIESE